jgi:predicted phage terminase large subunit-like protein
MTRLFPGSPIVFIMTRWSTTDPVARILDPEFQARLKDAGIEDADKWEVVNIPALCEDPETDLIGRREGESIFPERFSENEFKKIKAERGSFVWASLYCGRPTALGGNYVKVDRIRTVTRNVIPKDMHLFRYWDLAATEKKTSDYTVGILGGVDRGTGTFYVMDMIRGRWEWPFARDMIKRASIMDKARIGVEAVAGFKTAFSNLMEVLPPNISCSEFGADKDKMTRALPWMAVCENNKMCIVQGDWNIDLMLELASWPRGKHDDIFDAISGCYQMAANNIQYIMPSNSPKRFGQSDRGNRSIIG